MAILQTIGTVASVMGLFVSVGAWVWSARRVKRQKAKERLPR